MDIEIIVFDGFDELDAIGPFEVLRHAANAGAPFAVSLVGADGPGEISAANGLTMLVEQGIGAPDALVVPGGGWLEGSGTGARAQAERGDLPAKLAALAPSLRWTASVCTGAMLLAEAGLLRGRTATTNRGAYDQLRAAGTTVLDERVVDDGDVGTAGGPSCGIDLALWLTEREAGSELAARTAAAIHYDWTHAVWQRPQPRGNG
jgi:transcriptional regulator GlxA family with amidase domain